MIKEKNKIGIITDYDLCKHNNKNSYIIKVRDKNDSSNEYIFHEILNDEEYKEKIEEHNLFGKSLNELVGTEVSYIYVPEVNEYGEAIDTRELISMTVDEKEFIATPIVRFEIVNGEKKLTNEGKCEAYHVYMYCIDRMESMSLNNHEKKEVMKKLMTCSRFYEAHELLKKYQKNAYFEKKI